MSLAGFAHFLETLLGAPFPPPPARSVCGALWDRARRFFRDPLGTDIVSQVLELQAEDLARGDAYRLHRARERLCGVSTEKLKTDHVLPYTAASRVSLASQLRAAGSAHVAPANVFISHAYQYNFLDVFDAMLSWEAAQRAVGDTAPGPFFYYFDLFCVNQHSQNQNAVVPFEVLRDEFGGSVRAIGRTLLVLKLGALLPLRRAWCVLEIATSVAAGVHFEVVMPPRDAELLAGRLAAEFSSLSAACADVDVEKCEAREPADLESILRFVRSQEGGAARANARVRDSMGRWMIVEGLRAAAREEPCWASDSACGEVSPEGHAFLNNLALFCAQRGQLDHAEALHRRALALCELSVGEQLKDGETSRYLAEAAGRALRSARDLKRAVERARGDVGALRSRAGMLCGGLLQLMGRRYALAAVAPLRDLALFAGAGADGVPLLRALLALQRRHPCAHPFSLEDPVTLLQGTLQALADALLHGAARAPGGVSFASADAREAEALLREAAALGRVEGGARDAGAAAALGQLLRECGDPAGALPLLRERTAACQRLCAEAASRGGGSDSRARAALAHALIDVGYAHKALGERAAAGEAFADAARACAGEEEEGLAPAFSRASEALEALAGAAQLQSSVFSAGP